MEEEDPQPTQPEQSQNSEAWYAPLTRVTPLSKVLAAVFFVVLPLLGFWFGYSQFSGMQHGLVQHDASNHVAGDRIEWSEIPTTDEIAVLAQSFKKFRDVESVQYREMRSVRDSDTQRGVVYGLDTILEGTLMFPDRAHLTQDATYLARYTDGALLAEDVSGEVSNEVVFYGDSFYIKEAHVKDAENPAYGNFWPHTIAQLGDKETLNFTTDVLTAFKWVHAGLNLNNPKFLRVVEFVGEEKQGRMETLRYKVVDFNMENMMRAWNETNTLLRNQNFVEGYNIADMIETYPDVSFYNEGIIVLDKSTLLPVSIDFTFTIQKPRHVLGGEKGMAVVTTVTRKIQFTQYNNKMLHVVEPTQEQIVDEVEVEKYWKERMENLRMQREMDEATAF